MPCCAFVRIGSYGCLRCEVFGGLKYKREWNFAYRGRLFYETGVLLIVTLWVDFEYCDLLMALAGRNCSFSSSGCDRDRLFLVLKGSCLGSLSTCGS